MDGSRLPGGVDADEQILEDLREAEVVVGIISSASLESLYVAFELGARWGLDKRMIPIMAPGVSPSTISGPLSGKNALRADTAAGLLQLVSDVGGHLDIAPFEPASYQSDVEAILALPKQPVSEVPPRDGAQPVLGTEWLEQEQRFKRLGDRVMALWNEDTKGVSWTVIQKTGASPGDREAFVGESRLAARLLQRIGLGAQSGQDPEDRWLDVVREITESDSGVVLSGRTGTVVSKGGEVADPAGRSARACVLLAGGTTPRPAH